MMEGVISLDVGGSSVKSAVVGVVDRTNIAVTTTLIDSRGDKHTILKALKRIIQRHLLEVKQRNGSCAGIGVGSLDLSTMQMALRSSEVSKNMKPSMV